MTYDQAISTLYSIGQFGMKLGLETSLRLAESIGNPHHQLRFIHVAGTNGKGSTCAFLESIYRQSGLKVGLYTSPHLVRFGERIQVNRVPIPDAEIIRAVSQLKPIMETFSQEDAPTFFEVVTAMALLHFRASQCDLVIWETGLGGRLDATNIVTPLASLITSIGLDHQAWLGNSIEKIAAEKAGILKPGVPAISSVTDPAAQEVIRATAERIGAPLSQLTWTDTEKPPLADLRLPLTGAHQRMNAALALRTVQELQSKLPVTPEALRSGLETTQWPARFQKVARPHGFWIIDGAHNPEGAQALKSTLLQENPSAKPVLVLGILRDKSWEEMLQVLLPIASRVVLVPVQSDRTLSANELESRCRSIAPSVPSRAWDNLPSAINDLATEPFVVVAGSLLLAGQALEILGLQPGSDERALNERQPKLR